MGTTVDDVVAATWAHDSDRLRLIDILLAVQSECGGVDDAARVEIAESLGIPQVEVAGVVSFYPFLSRGRKDRAVIRLCNDVSRSFMNP